MNNVEGAPTSNTLGIIGLVAGIISVIFSLCCSWLGIILGAVALICGFIAKGNNQKFAMAGIILGAIGLVLSILFSILGALAMPFLSDMFDEFLREFDY